VTVANFSATKNQLRTADIFSRARLEGAVLCLIGSTDNDYSHRLAARIESGRPGVRPWKTMVLVNQSRDSVCAAIGDADVCLLTSRKETQSIFLLEGMAAGVPFVSTPAGCAAAWPGGLTARSSAGLVRALGLVAGAPRLRRELGEAGCRYVEANHTPEAVHAHWARLIGEVTGAGVRSDRVGTADA
jgi:glycosyltransferase involved in cell wall biosynthesis